MPMLTQKPATIFTISRLNQTVRQLLENEMGQIWLTGEISNLSQPSSGHWYFTLKDQSAQVRCAMFRHTNQRSLIKPTNGQQILARANMTLYEPRGDYQLIIESMQIAGDGALQQQFEQIKQQLHAQGLFDQQHKKPLPSPAACVGVITSASGAALHDILHVLQRRDPALPIIIYPSLVQGVEAPQQIMRAIALANQRKECDVLIVGRGGGSLEDLWCFNDKQLANAIFASQIPIVSAVGHEVDITIADLVADLRAPTPSAAAEMVSRNQLELLRHIQSRQQRLEMAMDYYLARKNSLYTAINHQLRQQHPRLRLARQYSALLALHHRMKEHIAAYLKTCSTRQRALQQRLNQNKLKTDIHHHQHQLQQQLFLLQQGMERQLHQLQKRFAITCSQLESCSPLAILARGYSVTRNASGALLRSDSQTQAGDLITTQLQEGWIESLVTRVSV